ncbi:MAG: hypothetical protein EOR97_27515 [Mesorhizobium sp.]|uniref:helix-turn-helix domain-containing protein n=1 Tax=Mesorhizobium sp. TaxID=1871066 RepID=UPI000FE91184|nr:helix-turn-helix domain-containing protein [Mesorhizobium sp.]RWN26818.1 MAG: hypothetical protein EOR97_27515 [Mesorhizobium sp.]
MLNEAADAEVSAAGCDRHHAGRLPARPNRSILRSATRPLEIIELFAALRRPLSVSEIACALEIPQSSSSVLLQAMSGAGFIARDRKTRKYLPSVRSVLLSNWVHDTFLQGSGLLQALDALSIEANANVRLGVRNGVHVQYVHVSWPSAEPRTNRLSPGMKLPIGRDALGRMLLLAENENDVRGILRHGNAVGDAAHAVNVEDLVDELRMHRVDRFAVCRDLSAQDDLVIAIQLPARFGAPAAIGIGVAVSGHADGRSRFAALLRDFAAEAWGA